MKNYILTAFLVLFLCGCASTKDQTHEHYTDEASYIEYPPSDLSACKDEDEAAQIMIKSVLNGLSTRNYKEFTRDFASKENNPFSLQAFNTACDAVDKNLGTLLSLQYLGSINKIGYTIALWKAKYSKAPEDIILEMYIVRENDEFKISAFIPK